MKLSSFHGSCHGFALVLFWGGAGSVRGAAKFCLLLTDLYCQART